MQPPRFSTHPHRFCMCHACGCASIHQASYSSCFFFEYLLSWAYPTGQPRPHVRSEASISFALIKRSRSDVPTQILQSILILPSSMSPVQEPVCTTDYTRTRIDAALIRAEILHPDPFYSGTFLEEGDAAMRKRAENVSQYKLPTYQAAAVVVRMVYSDLTCDADTSFLLSTQSTVLAGVESQLLVFFKSSPDFTQQPVSVILQYLLVLTYIALFFSLGTTISSLILTRTFGDVSRLVGRLQENSSSVALPTFESPPVRKRSCDDVVPWGWRFLEGHCTYDELRTPAAEPLTFYGR